MKQSKLVSTLILLMVLVMALPMPTTAQSQGDAEHQRAPRPPAVDAPAPQAPQPEWGGTWQNGPVTPWTWSRFDGEYYPEDGLVYFMGGRLPSGSSPDTDGSVWAFDPVAGTYTDTGVNIVTPVSNYTMNLLEDASGWGLYTFCGRPTGGGVVDYVQVYYPDTNTTVQLPAADNFPGTGNCTSGLNVVYDNKLYVAGGFDSVAMYGETWVFDPMAPSGSRWTRLLTANLTPARAYIMGALVDDLIYAIGGATFDGTNLVNLTTVAVLDPNAASPAWNDAAVLDLPEACSSSRAWGFDSDSGYLDPDTTPFAGKIVSGCGFWADENNHVYVYDTAANTWSAFPWLITDRRDVASAFIPSDVTAGGGVPGLWLWGGRKDADTTYLNSVEYYDVVAPTVECNVLLVDDDWEWASPHDGGLPYYTSTLDYLGYSYAIWDTDVQGTPTAGDMGPYEAVVWWTGYDWQDPISPTVEAPQLEAYLANGGSLFLSSQEQNYAYGNIPLFDNYLGVASMVDDVTLLDVTGVTGNVVGDGLGPYLLARPDDWDSYWPTDTYQGPYDDEVYPDATASQSFRYADAGNVNPNAITHDAGDYRTIYLGWPFEWVDTVEERAEIMDNALQWLCNIPQGGVSLQPSIQETQANPGDTVLYDLFVTNNTGGSETFDLTSGGNVWPATLPATIGPLGVGATVSFTVQVDLPADAVVPFVDSLVVTATAQTDPALYDSAVMNTKTVAAVDGHIYDANTGLPLAGYVTIYDNNDPNVGWETWANADGYYWFEDPAFELRSYDMYAAKVGYDRVDVTLTLTGQQTTTVDFWLPAALIEVDPASIAVTVVENMSTTVQLSVINNGTADLLFRIDEVAPNTGIRAEGAGPAKPLGVNERVYEELDASPDGTAEVLVVMAEQADLSAAYNIADWEARGQYVYNVLKATADRTQAGVRQLMKDAGVEYQTFLSVNALGCTTSRATIEALAALPGVQAIEPATTFQIPEPMVEPSVDELLAIPWNLANIRADDVWSTFGVTGEGIVVANIDTGVEYTHPALVTQYRGNLGAGVFDHNYNWWDPRDACAIDGYPAGEPCDNNGHGTHTMGSMVGSDNPADPLIATNAIGVAPGATWIACKGCEEVQGWPCSTFALLECADFIVAPWDSAGANPDPAMRPNIVNNSWGGSPDDGWYFNDALSAWRAAGIFPAFSGGNDGPNCSTSHSPGDYYNSFATGAVGSTDVIASFSSRGPSDLGVQKPQVAAPGASVRSSVPGAGYALYSGTSMASPHTAGEVALIWSAQPDLVGQVWATERLVEQTALEKQDGQCGQPERPNYVYGWGRIDAFKAVTTALSVDWDVDWLAVEPDMGTVPAGDELAVDVTLDAAGLTAGECYTAGLNIETNDPQQGLIAYVPVELCVVTEPVPDFYLTKAADPTAVLPGELVTFTLTFGNNGDAVTAVTIQDVLPAEVEFAWASDSGSYNAVDHDVTWARDLASGEEIEFTVIVTASAELTPSTWVTNVANLYWDNMLYEQDTAPFYVNESQPVPDLHLNKTANPTPVLPGQQVTFDITFSNTGDVVDGAELTDQLPAEVMFNSATGGGMYDDITHSVVWDGLTVDSTETTFQVVVTVKADTPPGVLYNDVLLEWLDWDATDTAPFEVRGFRFYLPLTFKGHAG